MRNKFIIEDTTPIQIITGDKVTWRGTFAQYAAEICPADSLPAVKKALASKGKYTAGGFTVEFGKVHRFELAGLGKAPFAFIGMNINTYQACPGAPIQPGGTCDYCGTGIMYEFAIRSADGKRSVVGCDCIARVGDEGLKRTVEHSPEYRKWQNDKKQAKIKATALELDALMHAHEAAMLAKPHPMGFTDRKTGTPLTYKDYADWMLEHSGQAGKERLLKGIKKEFTA